MSNGLPANGAASDMLNNQGASGYRQIFQSKRLFQGDFKVGQGLIAKREDQLVNKRKVLWKQNVIRTNRSNLPLPDSKAAKKAIVIKRKSLRNRVAANRAANASKAAANKGAGSKADDKLCRELTRRRERLPPLFLSPQR
jgi:hypothetical protein